MNIVICLSYIRFYRLDPVLFNTLVSVPRFRLNSQVPERHRLGLQHRNCTSQYPAQIHVMKNNVLFVSLRVYSGPTD
jgi:hypothetical protein